MLGLLASARRRYCILRHVKNTPPPPLNIIGGYGIGRHKIKIYNDEVNWKKSVARQPPPEVAPAALASGLQADSPTCGLASAGHTVVPS